MLYDQVSFTQPVDPSFSISNEMCLLYWRDEFSDALFIEESERRNWRTFGWASHLCGNCEQAYIKRCREGLWH